MMLRDVKGGLTYKCHQMMQLLLGSNVLKLPEMIAISSPDTRSDESVGVHEWKRSWSNALELKYQRISLAKK